jgi:hypothetical protein
MQVHPLYGQRLAVVFAKRTRSGARWVVVDDPAGHRLELPEAWTDLVPSVAPVSVDGRVPKLSAVHLLKMSTVLRCWQEVDDKVVPAPDGAKLAAGQHVGASDGAASAASDVGGTPCQRAARPAGLLGAAGASVVEYTNPCGDDGNSGGES